jgi:hypothetical protein
MDSTVTKRRFLSDVAQSYLDIEAHPNTGEVWIRVGNDGRQRGVTFRCSPAMADEIGLELVGRLLPQAQEQGQ